MYLQLYGETDIAEKFWLKIGKILINVVKNFNEMSILLFKPTYFTIK
jgi:hypothetical protein